MAENREHCQVMLNGAKCKGKILFKGKEQRTHSIIYLYIKSITPADGYSDLCDLSL